eukprot:29534-Rhodomonas_salina.1
MAVQQQTRQGAADVKDRGSGWDRDLFEPERHALLPHEGHHLPSQTRGRHVSTPCRRDDDDDDDDDVVDCP